MNRIITVGGVIEPMPEPTMLAGESIIFLSVMI
jgi:hypothetical protein